VIAQRILADEAGGEERERDAGPGEVNQHVVRGAAGPFGLATDVGELFRLGIDVNHLDLVNDPVAPGEEAATLTSSCVFHGGKAAAWGIVNETTRLGGKHIVRGILQDLLFNSPWTG
jgi:hypothetical protein